MYPTKKNVEIKMCSKHKDAICVNVAGTLDKGWERTTPFGGSNQKSLLVFTDMKENAIAETGNWAILAVANPDKPHLAKMNYAALVKAVKGNDLPMNLDYLTNELKVWLTDSILCTMDGNDIAFSEDQLAFLSKMGMHPFRT